MKTTPTGGRAWHRCVVTSVSFLIACIFWLRLNGLHTDTILLGPTGYTTQTLTTSTQQALFSGERSILNDIVLVIKTGATESLQKLPIHFSTTLKSWPHVLILSDFNENINGHRVYDALDIVTESIRNEEPSFQLWHRLREDGRAALEDSWEPETGEQLQWQTGTYSQRQDGWRLARFMNLPMAAKAREYKDDAKWYVFIDADSYVSRSNLIRLVQRLDANESIYGGSQVAMGPDEFFAHGGSGYILSQAAITKLVKHYIAKQQHYDHYAMINGYGEQPFARALMDIDIRLSWMYPHFQGGDPLVMDWGVVESDRKLWCYPAVTYHHVNAVAVQSLWEFEEAWTRGLEANRAFRHSDVFKQLILPQLDGRGRINWDNACGDIVDDVPSVDACGEVCERDEGCVQFSYHEGRCSTSKTPKLGHSKEGTSSAWMLDRIGRFVEDLDSQCEGMMLV